MRTLAVEYKWRTGSKRHAFSPNGAGESFQRRDSSKRGNLFRFNGLEGPSVGFLRQSFHRRRLSGHKSDDYTHTGRHRGYLCPVSNGTKPVPNASPTKLLASLALGLLVGCASQGPVIEQELAALEMRLSRVDARLGRMEREQAQRHEALSEAQRSGFSVLLETTVAEIDRLVHARPPLPVLIQPVWSRDEPARDETDGSPVSSTRGTLEGKLLIGSVENVRITPPGLVLPARIDTGAESSSLDAREIREFKRDGDPWVRFRIAGTEGNLSDDIEQPVVRHVRILQATTPEAERRPVVRLGIAIGSHTEVAEFTLSDREHLTYPVLVGRNVLTDVMVVDVGQSRIAPLPVPEDDGEDAAESLP